MYVLLMMPIGKYKEDDIPRGETILRFKRGSSFFVSLSLFHRSLLAILLPLVVNEHKSRPASNVEYISSSLRRGVVLGAKQKSLEMRDDLFDYGKYQPPIEFSSFIGSCTDGLLSTYWGTLKHTEAFNIDSLCSLPYFKIFRTSVHGENF